MTNPTDTKQQYEGAILQQLIKNSERLVTAENSLAEVKSDIAQIKSEVVQINKTISNAKNWLIAIALGVLVNIISPPLVSFFNH